MRGQFSYAVIVILLLQGFISWLVYILLRRLLAVFNHKRVQYGYWGLTLLSMAALPLNRLLLAGTWPRWMEFSFTWLIGLIFMLPLLLLWQGAVSFRGWLKKEKDDRKQEGPSMSRRDFLKASAAAAPLTAFGFSATGVYGASEVVLQRYSLQLPKFPAGLKELKIAQISDTHLGAYFSLAQLKGVLSRLQAEKPDMLVITGDFIDDLQLLEEAVEELAKAADSFPLGIYFCWGNHEYFKDIWRIRRALAGSPIEVLENSSRKIQAGEGFFHLAGVDYPWAKDKEEQEALGSSYLKKAVQGISKDAFIILIAHHPHFLSHSFKARIPFTLAGHTHGGQLGLFGKYPLPPLYEYMRGIYERDGCFGYVSVGTGHWLPFRLGCPAEAVIFTLSKKE